MIKCLHCISGITGGVTGQASVFTIDTSDVGAGTLAITVDGPSKVDLSCNEVDDGHEVACILRSRHRRRDAVQPRRARPQFPRSSFGAALLPCSGFGAALLWCI